MSLSDQPPFISVIIPVYNDTERLRICLEYLSQQTWSQSQFETIVVDNGSDQPVASAIQNFENVICITETQPGSYVARNTGLAVARGEILAFTDSDCRPEPQWLENGVARLCDTADCGLVGGGINLYFQHPEQPTAVELYELIFSFRQDQYVSRLHYAATANLFTSRDIIEEVGLFDEALKSGGDREWGQRVYQAGYQVVYEESAAVQHPARHTLVELKQKAERIAGGLYNNPERRNFTLSTFLPPLVRYFKIGRSSKVRGLRDNLRVMGVATMWKYYLVRELIRLKKGGSIKR